jgi:hypothetical protein
MEVSGHRRAPAALPWYSFNRRLGGFQCLTAAGHRTTAPRPSSPLPNRYTDYRNPTPGFGTSYQQFRHLSIMNGNIYQLFNISIGFHGNNST